MRSLCLVSLLLAALLAAAGASADQFETFYLDPSRSFLSFQSGDFSTQLSSSTWAYGPLTAQPGSIPAPLGGEFVLQIGNDASSPTFFSIIPGSSDVRPQDASLVSPGVGGTPGTSYAALGLSFLDSTLGISGDVAIHDLIFGINGYETPYANSLGPYGLQGDLNWILGAGSLEIQTSIGIGGTAFLPLTSAAGYIDRYTSQFSETSPGVYEVVMPFGFTLYASTNSGPFSNTNMSLTFGGEIVATNVVPEPATGALVALGLLGLAAGCRARSAR